MTKYELRPIYDHCKSFYGKAWVREEEECKTLISYNTTVARIDRQGNAVVYGTYSATTLRHIKEFLKQSDMSADSKAQIEKDYLKR